MKMRWKTKGCDSKSAPLPRRALIQPGRTVLFLFFASALLALSSRAVATPDDTDSTTGIVLPIVARQSVGSSSEITSRRRLFAVGENAANFSLPLEGAIKDYGYFTTSLLLGTPPKPFSVIVDTGSTLTYVACAGCASSGDCGPRHSSGPSGFDAAASATARRVECGDAERCSCGSRQQCGCESQSNPDSLEASLEGNCTWSREYAEESSASGRLVTDVVTLPLVGASKIAAEAAAKAKGDKKAAPSPPLSYRRVPVTFGCTTRETGEIFQQVADGILGMGASGTGFPSQLRAAGALLPDDESGSGIKGGSSSSSSLLPPLPTEDAPPPFSLCMGGPEGGGALLLGSWLPEAWVKVNGSLTTTKSNKDNKTTSSSPSPPLPKGKKPLVQTPLVPSPGHPYYYAVGLEGISLGGKALEGFDASVFREGHGAVLDSGTTFTYLPGAVFNALEKAVKAAAKAAKLPVVPGAGGGGGEGQEQSGSSSSYGDLCWGGLEGGEEAVRRLFPRMQLRFAAEEGAGGGGGAFGGKAAPSTSTPTSSSAAAPGKPKRILRRRRRKLEQESEKKKKASDEKSVSPPAAPQQQQKPKVRRRRPPLPAAEMDLPPLNYLFAHVSRPGAYCLGIFSADGKGGDESNQGPSRGSLLGGITTRDVLVQYDAARAAVGFGVGAGCRALGEGAAAGLEAARKRAATAAAAAPSPALAPAAASSSRATAKSADGAAAGSAAAVPASSSSSATVLVLSSVGAAAGAAVCFALAAVLVRRAWKGRQAGGFQPFADGGEGGGGGGGGGGGSGWGAAVADGGESGVGGGRAESRPASAASAAAATTAAAAAAPSPSPSPSPAPQQPQTLRMTELTPMPSQVPPPIVPALPPPPS